MDQGADKRRGNISQNSHIEYLTQKDSFYFLTQLSSVGVAKKKTTMQCGQSLHSGSDTSQVALVVGYKRVEREGEQETHSTGRRDSEQEKQRTRETENTRDREHETKMIFRTA